MPIDRGRLVVLVDNGVHGDSRVQKTARSAADAGWDVVLLGRSPDRQEQSWELGGARVRLLPVPVPPARRHHELRRASLRRPLAYPTGTVADLRRRQVKAWRADLRVRRAAARRARREGRTGPAAHAETAHLALQRLTARAAVRWVRLRTRQTRELERLHKRMDGPLDRFTTAFWQRAMGDRAWRRLDPGLWDYELAYGRELDALRADVIHANDFRMLGVGARAKLRAGEEGRDVRLVWDVHEFLPGIKPWNDHPRWHPAQCAHEREYARYADAVVTVSGTLAEMLVERHALAERPTVVLNAPDLAWAPDADDEPVPDLREQCGIGAGTPLIVYSGAAAPQRGLDIMVEALPALAEAHVALVVLRPSSPYVQRLLARAGELGVADRVHTMGYVPHHQVVEYLSAADAGVIPIQHWPNHEIALITKFFEYSHARLPLVVSDVRTMGETTRSTGQGEVFTAEDLEDYVRAVKAVLSEPQRYRGAYDRPGLLRDWTWERQAARLDRLYARLLTTGHAAGPGRDEGGSA